MRKLNQRKIRWIVKELKKGELSRYQVAKLQRISEVHTWRVFKKYNGVKKPKLRPCGRIPTPLTYDEIAAVKIAKAKYGFGAVYLEKVLAERGVHMPHNRIHRILKSEGLAREEPKKGRRRKWIRYERKHSNSLWHADWFEDNDKYVILYEDDASRLITGFGEFANATTSNALKIFDEAASRYGSPKQLMTDHGTQFCSDEDKAFIFREHIKAKGAEHILARVKHPQSNGKLERLVFTIKGLLKWKGTLAESVKFYNEVRPHMSLENDHLRTPMQAFQDKLRGGE